MRWQYCLCWCLDSYLSPFCNCQNWGLNQRPFNSGMHPNLQMESVPQDILNKFNHFSELLKKSISLFYSQLSRSQIQLLKSGCHSPSTYIVLAGEKPLLKSQQLDMPDVDDWFTHLCCWELGRSFGFVVGMFHLALFLRALVPFWLQLLYTTKGGSPISRIAGPGFGFRFPSFCVISFALSLCVDFSSVAPLGI